MRSMLDVTCICVSLLFMWILGWNMAFCGFIQAGNMAFKWFIFMPRWNMGCVWILVHHQAIY